MSGASINIPIMEPSKRFVVSSEKSHPESIVSRLNKVIKDSKEKAREKYKKPEEYWLEQLKLELEEFSDGKADINNPKFNEKYPLSYKITENGELYYKGKNESSWSPLIIRGN